MGFGGVEFVGGLRGRVLVCIFFFIVGGSRLVKGLGSRRVYYIRCVEEVFCFLFLVFMVYVFYSFVKFFSSF